MHSVTGHDTTGYPEMWHATIAEPQLVARNVLASQELDCKYVCSHHISCFTPDQWMIVLRYNDPVMAVDIDMMYNRGHMAEQWFHTEMYSSGNNLWNDASGFGALRLMNYLFKHKLFDDSKGQFTHVTIPKMAQEAVQYGFIRVLRLLRECFPGIIPLSIRSSKATPGVRVREFWSEWDVPCMTNNLPMVEYLLSVYPVGEITPYVFHEPALVQKTLIIKGYITMYEKMQQWLPRLTHVHADLAVKHKQPKMLMFILKTITSGFQYSTIETEKFSKHTVAHLAQHHMIMQVHPWIKTDEMKQVAVNNAFIYGDVKAFVHFSKLGVSPSIPSIQAALKQPYHKRTTELFEAIDGELLESDELLEACIEAGNDTMFQWLYRRRQAAGRPFNLNKNEYMIKAIHSKEPNMPELLMVLNPEEVYENRCLSSNAKWKLVEFNYVDVLDRAHTKYGYSDVYNEETLHAALLHGKVDIVRNTLKAIDPDTMTWERLMEFKRVAITTNSVHRAIRRECIDMLDARIQQLPIEQIPHQFTPGVHSDSAMQVDEAKQNEAPPPVLLTPEERMQKVKEEHESTWMAIQAYHKRNRRPPVKRIKV